LTGDVVTAICGALDFTQEALQRIAATGSVFELAYGDPDLGVQTTRLILAASVPGTLVALLLAIRINRPA
jgi:hypothetical protein